MIVTSGVLVFAAAALLIDGVFFTSGQSGTPWQIWASIVVSAAAALLLVAGALRERTRRPAPAGAAPVPAPAPPTREELRIPAAAEAAPSVAAASASAAAPIPAPAAPVAPAPTGVVGPPADRVLVVAGRPRYHRGGCRYVADRDAQELGVEEARAAGYTACGVCQPDDDLLGGDVSAAAAAPAVAAAPDERPDPVAPQPSFEPPSPPPTAAPAPTEPAAPPAPVVLVRNRYHRPDCRYVAVAAERREVSRAEARDGGALPCGVCRP